MKKLKKLIGILAVGCLILGGSGAVADAMIVAPYEVNTGTTGWTTATSAVGSGSFQLNNPASGGINWAGVLVTDLGNPTIAGFADWSYWTRSNPQFPGGYAVSGVNVRMWLDTPYANYTIGGVDQGWDVLLNVMPHNTLFPDVSQPIPADTWVNLNSPTRYPYQFFAYSGTSYLGGYDIATQSNAINWSEFQNLAPISTTWGNTYDFSTAIVSRVSLRTGGGGIGTDVTAYLDDFTLNGIPVIVEGGTFTVVPIPGAVWLLGSGLIGLVAVRRRVRK